MLQSSRLSLQAVLEIANSYISGTNSLQIVNESLAVVGVLAENDELRKTLADSSESAEKKQHLLRALFSTRTADAVLRIADAAVGQRWARTQDLVTSLEVAGVTAIAAAAQATGQLGEVEEEIFRFARLLESNHDQSRALESQAQDESKGALVNDLLSGKAQPETITLVEQASLHPRGLRVATALDPDRDNRRARRQRPGAGGTAAGPVQRHPRSPAAAIGCGRHRRQAAERVSDRQAAGGSVCQLRS